MYDVIVIGGGAAGMMAAIAAAREKASVLILEHMELCGKKILSTRNGRCNYTNKMQGIEYYRGDDLPLYCRHSNRLDVSRQSVFFRVSGSNQRKRTAMSIQEACRRLPYGKHFC